MNVGIFLAAGALVFAAPAQAQTSNLWHVNGSISGRTFVLDCRLDQGAGLCTDASKGGKSHPLTSLAVTGNQARWSFKTRVAFISVRLAFDGRIQGDRMSGAMSAAGRSGAFTAVRR